jgi:hypothetical protein
MWKAEELTDKQKTEVRTVCRGIMQQIANNVTEAEMSYFATTLLILNTHVLTSIEGQNFKNEFLHMAIEDNSTSTISKDCKEEQPTNKCDIH